nr:hypothetical protein [Tanacetum cinerariifolium]
MSDRFSRPCRSSSRAYSTKPCQPSPAPARSSAECVSASSAMISRPLISFFNTTPAKSCVSSRLEPPPRMSSGPACTSGSASSWRSAVRAVVAGQADFLADPQGPRYSALHSPHGLESNHPPQQISQPAPTPRAPGHRPHAARGRLAPAGAAGPQRRSRFAADARRAARRALPRHGAGRAARHPGGRLAENESPPRAPLTR